MSTATRSSSVVSGHSTTLAPIYIHNDTLIVGFSGAPGSGKNFAADQLERPMVQSVTTRPLRENQDYEYEHMSVQEFLERSRRGEFLWTIKNYGHWYGTRRSVIDSILSSGVQHVMHLDHSTVKTLQDYCFQAAGVPRVFSIFVFCRNKQKLIERMLRRAKISPQELEKRLKGVDRLEDECRKSGLYHEAIESHDLKTPKELREELMNYLPNPIPKPRIFT